MGKGKRYINKKKSFRNIIRIFFVLLFIISLSYVIMYFLNSRKEQKETNELLNTVIIDETAEKQDTKRIEQVKELKNTYPEVVSWIEIEGTNVNYPVMQREDNEFYMNHDYKGEKSIRGSIFLDKDYDWSIPSSNLMLYGHNNSKDGTMFADLLKYKDKNFYEAHPTIKFTTTEEDAEYEIISVFISRVYYKSEKDAYRWYYFINAGNEKQYNEYINNIKKLELYDTGKTAKYGEQLLTLVTCEYSYEDGRLAVVARKIQNKE